MGQANVERSAAAPTDNAENDTGNQLVPIQFPCVVVIHPFDPSTIEWQFEDQLPLALEKGQVVEVISDDGSGWALGRLTSSPETQGYFPTNFTNPVSQDQDVPESGATEEPAPLTKVALHAFDPSVMDWPFENQSPLALEVGSVIHVIVDEGGDWILGRLAAQPEMQGYFPRQYVAPRLVALHDFDPTTIEWPLEDQAPLSLQSGQIIDVLHDDGESEWVFGRLAASPETKGYFPKNYAAEARG